MNKKFKSKEFRKYQNHNLNKPIETGKPNTKKYKIFRRNNSGPANF